MGTNLARKRARKAQRRKLVVADKLKAEAAEASIPARVHRAAGLPLRCCLMTEALFEAGIGTLILARGTYDAVLAAFLIDLQGPGVKDVSFDRLDRDMFDAYTETWETVAPMIAIEPGYGRKLLREVVAGSRSIGFAPHRDYAMVELLFGDVDADACDAVFPFSRGAAA